MGTKITAVQNAIVIQVITHANCHHNAEGVYCKCHMGRNLHNQELPFHPNWFFGTPQLDEW